MAGWTAASLAPIMVGDRLRNFRKSVTDNVTRRALTAPQSVMGAGVTDPRLVADAPVTTTSSTSGNIPSFLQAGNTTMSNQGEMLDMISEILGLSKPDPKLVEAQIAQAQQDANRLFLQNQDVIKQKNADAALGYIQRQQQDLSASPFSYSGLRQNYADRARTIQNQGELNWLNMSPSYFSTQSRTMPRRGWTGPAMPGTWGI